MCLETQNNMYNTIWQKDIFQVVFLRINIFCARSTRKNNSPRKEWLKYRFVNFCGMCCFMSWDLICLCSGAEIK